MNTVESLYRIEYDSLVRHAARRVGRVRAEDAVQEAFTELLDGRAGDEDPLVFLTRRVSSVASKADKLDRRRAAILLRESLAGSEGHKHSEDVEHFDAPPPEYQPGAMFGYPVNKLGERTWS